MKKTKTKTKKERKATKRVFRQERSLSSFRHITTAFSVLIVVFTSFVSTTTHFTPFTMTITPTAPTTIIIIITTTPRVLKLPISKQSEDRQLFQNLFKIST
jgi:peptidoglycan/LPS O-acetylase OafA/YrhL